MSKVNPPPLKLPQSILAKPDERMYFEALNFFVYQLFQRSGGGEDGFEGLQEQITENAKNISINALNISANAAAIAINAAAIAVNSGNIAENALNIAINANDIDDLKKTFSWKLIPINEEVTIGEGQQMIVADGITVDGSLVIDGELSLI